MARRGWLLLVRSTYRLIRPISPRTLPPEGAGQRVLLTGDPLGPGAPLSPCKQKGQISWVDHVGCHHQSLCRPPPPPPSSLPCTNKYFLSETNGSLKLDSRDHLFEQNCWGQVSLIPISPWGRVFSNQI